MTTFSRRKLQHKRSTVYIVRSREIASRYANAPTRDTFVALVIFAPPLFANKAPMQLFQPSKVVYSPYGVSMDRPTVPRICQTRVYTGPTRVATRALARAILHELHVLQCTSPLMRCFFFVIVPHTRRFIVILWQFSVAARDRNHRTEFITKRFLRCYLL